MDYKEITNEALNSLSLNKVRTFLATLGIVIGIGSVIALVSLGQAGQKAVESQIQSLGSNLLTVVPGALRPGDFQSASGTSTSLTLDDAKAISENPGVRNISAEILRRTTVTAGRESTNAQIIGVLPSYQIVRNIEMQTGAFIGERDIDGQTKVAVLGPQASEDLFGEAANPV